MTHQLALELQFARQKWFEGHADLTDEDARKRLGHANSMGWMIGHLAWFEQLAWVEGCQEKTVSAYVQRFNWSTPASTPPLKKVLSEWHLVTAAADEFLNEMQEKDLATMLYRRQRPLENVGTMLRRQIWHYWYHLGEMQAIRQMLGHTNLPAYIGQMGQMNATVAYSATGS